MTDQPSALESFLSEVSDSKVNEHCMIWRGGFRGRYGYVPDPIIKAYGVRQAHRWAWIMFNGPIPEGMMVCHRCDNPPCINPAHLFLGTARDNALDCVAKGRTAAQRKTHCRNGHPYAGDNLRVKTLRGFKSRVCRICAKATRRTIYERERLVDRGIDGARQ